MSDEELYNKMIEFSNNLNYQEQFLKSINIKIKKEYINKNNTLTEKEKEFLAELLDNKIKGGKRMRKSLNVKKFLGCSKCIYYSENPWKQYDTRCSVFNREQRDLLYENKKSCPFFKEVKK